MPARYSCPVTWAANGAPRHEPSPKWGDAEAREFLCTGMRRLSEADTGRTLRKTQSGHCVVQSNGQNAYFDQIATVVAMVVAIF
jgi:hypothetical protein